MKKLLTLLFLLLTYSVSVQAIIINYTYNALGHVTSATYDNGVVIRYTYDALGQRLTKVVTAPAGLDTDQDGVPDNQDACPFDPNDPIGNPCNHDEDNDGTLDINDAFPLDPNESLDTDGDGIGNNADPDDDNDGTLDAADAFPLDPNETLDADRDGTGDIADPDDDNDGLPDVDDPFPFNPQEQGDQDGDGVGDSSDYCSDTAIDVAVDIDGCAVDQYPIVLDGHMEAQDFEVWRPYSQPPILEKTAVEFFEGLQSTHINTENNGGGLQQINLQVEAGQWYLFKFNYLLLRGFVYPRLGIHSSNGDFEGTKVTLSNTSNEWQSYARQFYVPDNFAGDFRVVIHSANSDFYLDDMAIIKLPAPLIVTDGNMEMLGVGAWRSYASPLVKEKSITEAVSGRQSIHINTVGIGAGIQQVNLPVEAGQWYEYSFQYKLGQGEIRTLLGINDSNGDFEGKRAIIRNISNNWNLYTRQFQVPLNFTGGFRIVISSRDADLFLDDVQINPIPAP